MGIYDRSYIRDNTRSPSVASQLSSWSITYWLIAINVAVFILDTMSQRRLREWGELRVVDAVGGLQVWRFLTFQFLHQDPMHILYNMLGLYWFGSMVESHFGSRRYLLFYLLCGLGGAAAFVAMTYLHLLGLDAYSSLVGASAGIFGVLVGAMVLLPDLPILLFLMPFPIRLQTLGLIYIGIAVYSVLTSGPNAGGQAAHLGGAAIGFLLMKNQHFLDFARPRSRLKYGGKRVPLKDWRNDLNR